jgi:hypothetical protein
VSDAKWCQEVFVTKVERLLNSQLVELLGPFHFPLPKNAVREQNERRKLANY